jgi:hypothetical protein
MSKVWISEADLEGLGTSLASLSRKGAKTVKVILGDTETPTPHLWRSRKEASRWLEALAVYPVWRHGVYYDYLYEGITLRPAPQVNGQGAPIEDDELAFEGEPLEPPNDFLDAATTFEVPTEASIADLDSKSHIPVAKALAMPTVPRVHPLDEGVDVYADLDIDDANLEEWAARTRANAEVQHDARTHSLIETVKSIRQRLDDEFAANNPAAGITRERLRDLDLDDSDKEVLARDPAHAPSLTELTGPFECGEVVLVGTDEMICELVEGHPGVHRDMEAQFEWGAEAFFGMGILGGGPIPPEGVNGATITYQADADVNWRCESTHGGIRCQEQKGHDFSHTNRLQGAIDGVPNSHVLYWKTPDDDSHYPAYGAARSGLAGAKLEIPDELSAWDPEDIEEFTESALRLLSVDIECHSTCVVDGTRCTLVLGHDGWHWNDTRTWRWGAEDPESTIDPLERNDTFSDTTFPTIYNGGIKTVEEAADLGVDLKPGGDLYGSQFEQDDLLNYLEAVEGMGIPEGLTISVGDRSHMYTWEGTYWEHRQPCYH